MDDTATVPPKKLRFARECFDTWLKQKKLGWHQLYLTTGGLSERNVRRLFEVGNYPNEMAWINALNLLFTRLHEVAKEKKLKLPVWPDFFSGELPLPTVRNEPALYNKAEIQSDELRSVADPLLNLLEKQAKIAADQKNIWKASGLYNHVCDLAELAGYWTRAEIHLARLAELNTQTGDFHFAADAYLRRGQVLLHNRQAEAALLSIEDGIRVIKDHKGRTPPHRVYLRLLSYKAIAKLDLDDPQEARRILIEEALPLASKECSPPALASVHNRLALVELKLGGLPEAMKHVLLALEIRLKSNMRSEVARSLATLARVHWAMKEIEQAVFIGELSLYLQEALNDHETLAQTHYFLGTAYAELNEDRAGGQKHKLVLRMNPACFRNPNEANLLEKAYDMAAFPPIERRSGEYRTVAIQHFKSCAFHERNMDAKQFPAAAAQAQKLVEARRGEIR